ADVASDGSHGYHVTAVNVHAFESGPSETVEVAVGDVEPPAPVVLGGTVLGFDVELTWTASASPDVARYDLYRDGAKIAEHADLVQLLYVDRALPNGTYAYLVRAIDGAGNESADSNTVMLTVSVPSTFPLSVTPVPEGRALDLAWQPVSEPPAASFRIWRAPASGGPYEALAETTATAHRDAPLVDGTPTFYVVLALDGAGNALASSNEASGIPRDLVPPPAPDLHHPTAPGVPLALRDGSVTLVASAEPEATVDFFRDGVAVGSAAATVAAALVTGDRPDHGLPRLSPDGETVWGLTYTEDGSDSWLLHHVASGHDETVLEDSAGARWTADSRRLIFATDEDEIMAYDVVRREVEALAATDRVDLVVPSPAVDRLAVDGIHDGQGGIWILDLESAQWTRVASVQPFNEPLEWSPSGRHLVYGYADRLYLLDVETGAATQLAGGLGTGDPSWSPDGMALAYPVRSGSLDQVWRYRLDLGTSEQMTFDPAGASRPQWSPDGRRFAYLSGTRQVVARDWATGTTELLYESATTCSPCTLQWVAGGRLWIDASGAEWLLWSPAGLAAAPATALAPGVNTFVAIAGDAAGNASEPSLPISLEWD
ncbi:MAG: hypothetical protein ACRD0X_05595, partial [Thermoanaerobaculia bacterium]